MVIVRNIKHVGYTKIVYATIFDKMKVIFEDFKILLLFQVDSIITL